MTNTRRINTTPNTLLDDIFWGGFATDTNKGYPPYNIVYVSDSRGYLEFAVAGFKQDELKVNITDKYLVVSGSSKEDTSVKYTHKGIARRDFERKFTLAPNTVVSGATHENGILRVDFEVLLPEEKKPREVPINFVKNSQFLRD